MAMKCLLTLFALAQVSQAAPALDPGVKYAVTDKKKAAEAPQGLKNYLLENAIIYESFAGAAKEPTMSNETHQKIRVTRLPEKDGVARTEMLYQKFTSLSRVALPGALKPYENRQDLGAYLFDKPLVMSQRGNEPPAFENLSAFREGLEKTVRDPIARQGLKANFSDDALKAAALTASPLHLCLEGFAGKAPGSKWELDREIDGAKLKFKCEFLGWGDAGGKPVEVVAFSLPKQKNTRLQPSGVPGEVETSGTGTVVAEPKSGEILVLQTTDVSAEPTQKEIEARNKAGSAIPKTKGTVRTTSHFYAG
ncbi:MAG: hypothetical protein EOP11_08855 [Proteobacteria bacterium]|nr:MAG: hypothetical protein EOP11_08855 [Pseudomonadota bacterium]